MTDRAQPQTRAELEGRMFRVADRPGYSEGSVPWRIIAPHERQARANHGGQSLEKLHNRGGLSWCEAIAVLEDREWRPMPQAIARAAVEAFVARTLTDPQEQSSHE